MASVNEELYFTQHQTIRHSTQAAPRNNGYAQLENYILNYIGTSELLDTFGRARYDIFLLFGLVTSGYWTQSWATNGSVDETIVKMHDQEWVLWN